MRKLRGERDERKRRNADEEKSGGERAGTGGAGSDDLWRCCTSGSRRRGGGVRTASVYDVRREAGRFVEEVSRAYHDDFRAARDEECGVLDADGCERTLSKGEDADLHFATSEPGGRGGELEGVWGRSGMEESGGEERGEREDCGESRVDGHGGDGFLTEGLVGERRRAVPAWNRYQTGARAKNSRARRAVLAETTVAAFVVDPFFELAKAGGAWSVWLIW